MQYNQKGHILINLVQIEDATLLNRNFAGVGIFLLGSGDLRSSDFDH